MLPGGPVPDAQPARGPAYGQGGCPILRAALTNVGIRSASDLAEAAQDHMTFRQEVLAVVGGRATPPTYLAASGASRLHRADIEESEKTQTFVLCSARNAACCVHYLPMHGYGTDDIAWGLVFALKLPTHVPLHGHGTPSLLIVALGLPPPCQCPISLRGKSCE